MHRTGTVKAHHFFKNAITSTQSLKVTTTTQKESKKPKKTTSDDDFFNDDDDEGDYTKQTVISAVYLHPEPSSKSENSQKK